MRLQGYHWPLGGDIPRCVASRSISLLICSQWENQHVETGVMGYTGCFHSLTVLVLHHLHSLVPLTMTLVHS